MKKVLHHRDGRCLVIDLEKEPDQFRRAISDGFSDFYTVLYAKDGSKAEVFSQDEHDQLIADGYADSPAKFGVETHPAKSGADAKIAANSPAPTKAKKS